ncbi:MAG: hypothetical protein HWE30_02690 [Methylocystaceae bacterium]|nr:hypothetical protein [Methylocystaceae bacterium]
MHSQKLLVVLFMMCSFTLKAHAQTAELAKIATYTSSVNKITQGFSQIVNRTNEWDELAIALLEK